MHILRNSELTVMILDPVVDSRRLGSRYCSGGYIWQVLDKCHGELFTGPEYPREPNTFDGQGAPDMFQTPLGADDVALGGEVECIGVGRVRRTSPREPFDVRYNREVTEFVQWKVDRTDDLITMRTEHVFRDWAYWLMRKVSLRDRAVVSQTAIGSLGVAPLPIRWYAHPFFPVPADNVLCRFAFPIALPQNPGYFMNAESFIVRKPAHDWHRGCYQALDATVADQTLLAVQKHPLVGEVTVKTDFAPVFLPIWGNDRTFSFEPYFQRFLENGAQARWRIEYHFGESRADLPKPAHS